MYEEKVDAAVTDRVAKIVEKRRRENPLFYRFLPTYAPLSLVNLKHVSPCGFVTAKTCVYIVTVLADAYNVMYV